MARYFLREVSTPPEWCATPPWYLVSQRHICAIRHFATYRAIVVRYPIKRISKSFAILSLRVSRDMRSIAAGPLRTHSESGRGGWKTQGGGKHTVNSAKNPSPKTFLDAPPTIRFPPLFWRLSVISLKRKRHRTRPTPISEFSKSGFGEHTLQYVFPPPKFTRYVLPPPQPQPNSCCVTMPP